MSLLSFLSLVRVGFLLVGIARVGVSGGVRSTGVAGIVFSVAVVFFIFVKVGSGGVAGVGALALVIGALRLWSGRSFSGHFGVVFPITRINGLSKGVEFREGVGFTNAGDSSLIWDGSPQYNCWHRVASPHWTQAARWLKSTRYFTMCWFSCMCRFSRSASASPSGSCSEVCLRYFYQKPAHNSLYADSL